VRIVDFLILLLSAHAQALDRLAQTFGEEVLLAILDRTAEKTDEDPPFPPLDAKWFRNQGIRGVGTQDQPYAEIQDAITAMKLLPGVEFHVWAYPYYRRFIESSLDLNAWIQQTSAEGDNPSLRLIDDAIAYAHSWARSFPVVPEYLHRIEHAVHFPWVRFRSQAMRRLGVRPMELS